jgi:hypothetical protein
LSFAEYTGHLILAPSYRGYNDDGELLNVTVVVILTDLMFLQNVKISAVSTWGKSRNDNSIH